MSSFGMKFFAFIVCLLGCFQSLCGKEPLSIPELKDIESGKRAEWLLDRMTQDYKYFEYFKFHYFLRSRNKPEIAEAMQLLEKRIKEYKEPGEGKEWRKRGQVNYDGNCSARRRCKHRCPETAGNWK
ncbi:hypothetical protein BVX99_01440 [bacterium F16]|nr:hypothetical protein BVX99_01440 [bacterium F16]